MTDVEDPWARRLWDGGQMKRLRWLILIPLFIAVILIAQRSGPVTGEWSEPVDGVQAALRATVPRVQSGQVIPVSIVFRNTSDATQELPVDLYMGLSLKHDGRVYADVIGTPDALVDATPLTPGEEREYPLTTIGTKLEGAGVYSVEGSIGEFDLARIGIVAK